MTGPALLLIGHGSRSAAGVDQFWELAALVRERSSAPVGCGLIEFAEPTLDQAIDGLVAGGADHVVAVPLVLLGAGHMKDDGPAALNRARLRHAGVAFSYAHDLGVHPTVLSLVELRCREAIAGLDAAEPAARSEDPRRSSSSVVIVGRGSTDPDANSDLYKAARLLADNRHITGEAELSEIEPAFVSLARPSLLEALERARRLGASRFAVVPYFLFQGILVDRIADLAHSWSVSHPDLVVGVGREIGPHGDIADLVVARYEEALQGSAHMNCDCCLYRTPLPGFEERLGAPLPH